MKTFLSILLMMLVSHIVFAQENWPQHGYDQFEQRYSLLDQINKSNVSNLGLAWYFDTEYKRGLEATPIVIDGIIYTTGNWSVVYALDAKDGTLIWKYDPQVPKEWGSRACCDVVNRGVAVEDGKVVFGTLDARLIALDIKTGTLLWSTQTADIEKYPYTITGAPRIAKGKVFIGNGGAEYGVRGYVGAYDLDNGELVWRFYTVPGNPKGGFENAAMERAASTWTGEWWKLGGGGTVWDSIVYDEELDQLYIGVGNGSPWNQYIRSPQGGDNLFLSSIVALNPDTGKYLWHYQETPADNWDYTATQHMMLATMTWKGKLTPVIWHAPKNGFFFVVNRITGRLLSATPYVKTTWAKEYNLKTGRPIKTGDADYKDGYKVVWPSQLGAHNWQPMAHSPQTGLVYVPVIDAFLGFEQTPQYQFRQDRWNTGVEESQGIPYITGLQEKIASKLFKGFLMAWDPEKQKIVWKLNHKYSWNGGLLATAGGLVFQGTAEGKLLAVDAETGNVLWDFPTQVGVMAPPVTFMVEEEQYVAVMAGWGGAFGLAGGLPRHHPVPPGRLLVFKLGGSKRLPAKEIKPVLPDLPPRLHSSSAQIKQGQYLYDNHCYGCHGFGLVANHAVPDLRQLPKVFYQNWDQIVRGGMMAKLGMPSFKGILSKEESDAIYAFVLDAAYDFREEKDTTGWYKQVKSKSLDFLIYIVDALTKLL